MPEEFPGIVKLANESHGAYQPNPEDLSVSSAALYITTTDGVRHIVINNGNTYLLIDGDSYDTGYDWLSSWNVPKGNAMISPTFAFDNGPLLTLKELKIIAQKGDAVSWEAFEPYEGQHRELYPRL